MKIVFAADPFALGLRKALVEHLKSKGHEVVDYGASEESNEIPYFESCPKACEALQRGEAERGILLCGTGLGMNQIANRFDGVRAAVCFFDAEKDRIMCCYEGDAPHRELSVRLGKRLPRYMIPNIFRRFDARPLTAGGKLDRQALRRAYDGEA